MTSQPTPGEVLNGESVRLLPCPFCAGAASHHVNRDRHRNDGEHDIECDRCGAAIRKELTKADAIAAWNTRQQPSGGQDGGGELERLKETLLEEVAVAAEQSDATPMERFVAEALCSDDAKAKGLVDRVWVVSLPDARKAIAAVEAFALASPAKATGWPSRADAEKLPVVGTARRRPHWDFWSVHYGPPVDMDGYETDGLVRLSDVLALFTRPEDEGAA